MREIHEPSVKELKARKDIYQGLLAKHPDKADLIKRKIKETREFIKQSRV